MNIEEIVEQIDGEISKLQQARVLLLGSGSPVKKGPGRPKASSSVAKVAIPKKRRLSAAGRARISAALKKRWAEKKKTVEAVKKAVPAKR